jgi:hypothetical protein
MPRLKGAAKLRLLWVEMVGFFGCMRITAVLEGLLKRNLCEQTMLLSAVVII